MSIFSIWDEIKGKGKLLLRPIQGSVQLLCLSFWMETTADVSKELSFLFTWAATWCVAQHQQVVEKITEDSNHQLTSSLYALPPLDDYLQQELCKSE